MSDHGLAVAIILTIISAIVLVGIIYIALAIIGEF